MTTNYHQLQAASLEMSSYLQRAVPALLELSQSLRSGGRSQDDLQKIEHLAEAIEVVSQYLEALSVTEEHSRSDQALRDLVSASQLIVQAQEQRDYGLLADVIEFDLKLTFDQVLGLSRKIQDAQQH